MATHITKPGEAITALLDHPGWLRSSDGHTCRAFSRGATVWTVVYRPSESTAATEVHSHTAASMADVFDPADLATPLSSLGVLRKMGRVHRLRNPDVWDALLPPLMHQRRTVDDAAGMYRRLCDTHGRVISTEVGPALLAPRPDVVAGLSDSAFAAISLKGKAKPLRAMANAYLARTAGWTTDSPGELFKELLTLPYVGRWSAGVVTSDVTSDFSYYVFSGDVSYERWQELFRMIGSDLSAARFKEAWDGLDRCQLSTLVLLTLASTRAARLARVVRSS
jgi:hypothetical protein